MTLFELEVTLFASARALSGVLSTHRSLPGVITAIFEVHGAISAHFGALGVQFVAESPGLLH